MLGPLGADAASSFCMQALPHQRQALFALARCACAAVTCFGSLDPLLSPRSDHCAQSTLARALPAASGKQGCACIASRAVATAVCSMPTPSSCISCLQYAHTLFLHHRMDLNSIVAALRPAGLSATEEGAFWLLPNAKLEELLDKLRDKPQEVQLAIIRGAGKPATGERLLCCDHILGIRPGFSVIHFHPSVHSARNSSGHVCAPSQSGMDWAALAAAGPWCL
jgi:hypothetical protein